MKTGIWILALCAAAGTAAAEQVVAKAVADTWIEIPEFGRFRTAEAARPGHGSARELVLNGRSDMALVQFDVSAARGLTVSRATLRVHRAPAPLPLHTVGLSTISGAAAWSEAAAGFSYAREGRERWSFPGSDVVDVTFGQGGSLYSYQRVRDAGEGWYEIDVPPALVHALLSGDQYGLLLSDEKGQTRTRHSLSSREGAYPPVLLIEGTRRDRVAPATVRAHGTAIVESTPADARALGRTTLEPGSAIVRFGGAGDDAGKGIAVRYELRYSARPIDAASFEAARLVPRWCLDPLAPKADPLANANALRDEVAAVVEGLEPGRQYWFAARATDEAGNRGPVSPLGRYRAFSRTFPELPAATPAPVKTGAAKSQVWAAPELWKIDPRTGNALEAGKADHRAGNAVWDADASKVRLEGARNEFVAFQLAVEGKGLAGIEVTIEKPLFGSAKLPAVFRQTGAVQLYREWFVPDDKQTAEPRGWYPDPLIPLTAPFDIPARDNAVPGQTVQPLFVDVWIPHDAAPGKHLGSLLVKAPGLRREITIEVQVLPFALPDKLNFVVDLNCYSGVNGGYNIQRGTPEYRKLEVAYHRLAHLHRANLDVLGYTHDGGVGQDRAPGLTGEGAATRISDWTAWDALYGPVLDGSAFRDLPRAGVPVAAIYLPFFENWPGDLRRSYRHNNYPIASTEEEYLQIIARHGLEAAPVEESFSKEYQDRFSAVAAQFADHLRERNWNRTAYYAYFNDKYYYKRPVQGGKGISWWLLDEPNHRDDVRAISFLAGLLKRGLATRPDAGIRLRTDISRVEWLRDLMPGQIDLNCVSRHFFDRNRYLLNDRRRFGNDFWHYATTNHPRDTNVSVRAWCWNVWLHGGNGVVPWNAVRGSEAWERAEPLTVFYPGTRFGKNEPFGSLRLKAYRRGQQDMEYLVLLAKKAGWDRDAVARAASGALDLSGDFRQADEEDAGSVSFNNVKDGQFEAVRQRVARVLSEQAGAAADVARVVRNARRAPALPEPVGKVVRVTDAAGLRKAVAEAVEGTTILVADGRYPIDELLIERNRLTIRGESGDRAKVILDAGGKFTKIIRIRGAKDLTIADLTVANSRQYGIFFLGDSGVERLTVYNVKFHNCYTRGLKGTHAEWIGDVSSRQLTREQAEKVRPRFGQVRYCLFVNDDVTPNLQPFNGDYVGAIDAMWLKDWVIADNTFINIRGRNGGGRGAIFIWVSSEGVVAERNLIVNCDRGICFGNPSGEPLHMTGGIVRNNFIVAGPGQGIEICRARNTAVLANTVFAAGRTEGLVQVHQPAGEGNRVLNNLLSRSADWFADAANGDLHLTATGLAAAGRAEPLPEVPEDIDGQKRSNPPHPGADEQ